MIHYRLTEQEVVRGLLKYRKINTRRWVRLAIGVFGALEIIYSYQLSVGKSELPFTIGIVCIVFSIVLSVLTPLYLRKAVAKVVRSNPVFTDTKDVSFDQNGIVFSTATRKSELMWAVFKKFTEDEQYFYLHTDDLGNVTLLPKRAFDSDSQEEFLRCSQLVPRA